MRRANHDGMRVLPCAAGLAALLLMAGALAAGAGAPQEAATNGGGAEWAALFNGENLSGWVAEGHALWTVTDGCITGVQGPDGAAGDLFTKASYSDFELRVVYRVQWPANTGVWFRYQSPEQAYQADILEYQDPIAYTGSLYCPGRMFIAINEDPDLEKRDDWNTMVITARGGHLVIRLNGTVTADVHDDSFAAGRIGFQVHAGDAFSSMKIMVREISIREL